MRSNISGIALVTVIIFVLLLSIIAVAMLVLTANYPLLVQNQIKRTQAQYSAEGAFWRNFMRYAVNAAVPPSVTSPIQDPVDGITYQANVAYQGGAGQNNVVVKVGY
jgi:hypothetical protein